MPEKKILFIVNPVAGSGDHLSLHTELDRACRKRTYRMFYRETTGENDARMLQNNLREIRPDAVVVCGGDGTVNMVGGELLGTDIPLCILPCGSANGLATELGLTGDPSLCLDLLENGRVIDMDVLVIDSEHLCFHLADLGTNARLVQDFEERSVRGNIGYLLSFIGGIFNRHESKATIRLPNKKLAGEVEMVALANARMYGTGAILNPDGRIDDRQFELCLFRPVPRHHILKVALAFFTGGLKSSDYTTYLSTERASIQLSQPFPLQVDGEVMGEVEKLEAELHKEKLRVVAPPAYPEEVG